MTVEEPPQDRSWLEVEPLRRSGKRGPRRPVTPRHASAAPRYLHRDVGPALLGLVIVLALLGLLAGWLWVLWPHMPWR